MAVLLSASMMASSLSPSVAYAGEWDDLITEEVTVESLDAGEESAVWQEDAPEDEQSDVSLWDEEDLIIDEDLTIEEADIAAPAAPVEEEAQEAAEEEGALPEEDALSEEAEEPEAILEEADEVSEDEEENAETLLAAELTDGTYSITGSGYSTGMYAPDENDSPSYVVKKGDQAWLITRSYAPNKYDAVWKGKRSEAPADPATADVIEGTMIADPDNAYRKNGTNGGNYHEVDGVSYKAVEFVIPLTMEELDAGEVYFVLRRASWSPSNAGKWMGSNDNSFVFGNLTKTSDSTELPSYDEEEEEFVYVTLTAKNAKTGETIAEPEITLTDPDGTIADQVEGEHALVPGVTYSVTITADGYRTYTGKYTASAEETAHAFEVYEKTYYLWLQVSLAEKQYAESTPAGTNRGEVVTIQKGDEEPVQVEPDDAHYVFNDLIPGQTYTITVTWEGHDVIVGDEWSVEKHGYYFITEDTSVWTKVYEIPENPEKDGLLNNLIARFIPHEEEPVELDFTAVEEALDNVPSNLRYFTTATADAVRQAVQAVDYEAKTQEEVDAMAEAIKAAVQGLIPKDGTYEVSIEKYHGTPYYLYEGLGDSDKNNGKAVLVVENGKMSAQLVLKNKSYAQVALGTAGDVAAAATAAGGFPAGTIEITLEPEQVTVNNKKYNASTVTVPVAALQTKIDYAYHSSNSTRYDHTAGWYNHSVMYLADSLVPISVEPVDEVINLAIYDEELMFKAVNAYVEFKDGAYTLVFALSGNGYEDIMAATYAQAMADPGNKNSWIHFTDASVSCVYTTASGKQNDGVQVKHQFRVPFTLEAEGETQIPIVAISKSKLAAAQKSGDYSNVYTGRQALLDIDAGTVVFGNYEQFIPVTVTSNISNFKVKEDGELFVIGWPTANEYTCAPTIFVDDDTYDYAFIGTAAQAEAADAEKWIDGGDEHVFGIAFKNSRDAGTTGDKAVISADGKAVASFHNADTDAWIERTFTMDAEAKTVIIDGEEDTIASFKRTNLSIFDEELMFKVVNAYVETDKETGAQTLVVALSAKGYQDLFAGTYDEAIANGTKKENWIHYTEGTVNCVYETKSGEQNDGRASKYQFRIPVTLSETGETRVPIVAISNTRATAAEKDNPENPDYSAAFTARQALINLEEKTIVTGNYKDNLEVKVVSNIETFAVAEDGALYIVGTPLANEYTWQPTITLTDDAYDKVFLGSVKDVDSADETSLISIAEDKVVVLPFQNSLGKNPQINDGAAVASFHSVKYDKWVERTFTWKEDDKTIQIDGEKLKLQDGTYEATKVLTDINTDVSGMIMVTKAIVTIKDGKATAIVTMKGTGADRLYVNDTATKDTIIGLAVAEEQKEVGAQEDDLLGGLKLEGSSAYSFWPIPITLGEPKLYAARSASHFSKQDQAPEKYYYVHDFQINEEDLKFVSEDTELPITPQQEAQRYLNQYFLDGKVVTAATAASVTGKDAKVTIPYYDANGKKISSVVMKNAFDTYRAGWFFDSSILNSAHFSSSNLKKIRYPEGSKGTVTFSPKATYRDEGMSFTATLKLFDKNASYNEYDASGVYYDQEPLAEQTFQFTLEPLPGEKEVKIVVQDAISKETIESAVITVTGPDGALAPEDGVYKMAVPNTYQIEVSAEGYVVPGTEDTSIKEEYTPSKAITLTYKLVKAEESKNKITFVLKDQLGDAVVNPSLTVYRWDDKSEVAAAEDGSYELYNGIRYGYTVKAEGYEDKTGSLVPEKDGEEEVLVNKYLSEQQFTFRVYDFKTNEDLEDVELTVKFGPAGQSEDTFEVAQPDENGIYTIAINNRVIAYGHKTGYKDDSLGVWSLGFDPIKNCSFSLTPLPDADYTAVDAAIAKVPEDVNEEPAKYTEASVKALNAALDAVVRGKKTDEQDAVDAMADAINAALPLEENTADYSAVDAALAKIPADLSKEPEKYTEASVKALNAAVNAVERGLKYSDKDKVAAMAAAIEAALPLVEKDADYSAVDAALAKIPADLSGYTDASVKALNDAKAAVKRDLKISDQSKVNAMAKAIEDAIAKLEKKPVTPAAPQKLQLIAAYNGAYGIGTKWVKLAGATEYTIWQKFNGVWKAIKTVKATDSSLKAEGNTLMYTDQTVKNSYGKGFIYSVSAKVGNTVVDYDRTGVAIYRLKPPTLKKLTNTKAGTVKVTWTKAFGKTETNGAYDVQYATEADAKAGKWTSVPVKSNTATSTTISGLKKGTKYVFRIRCSKTNKDRGTFYSEYSKWMSVTVKK